MYKVLIADDNAITRESIMLTIDWKRLGARVVAEADNGMAALALTDEHKPDIIITDIKMPGMDGLKFTEKVKSLYPSTKVIIITGYSEFTYAKEALRLGAFNLAVKPIDNAELTETLEKAVKTLDTEKSEQVEKMYLETTVRKDKILILTTEIVDILEGHGNSENLDSQLKRFFVFTSKFIKDKNGPDDMHDCYSKAKQEIEKLKKEYPFELLNFWFNDCFTVIAAEKSSGSGRLSKVNAEDICKTFLNNCGEKNTVIGVGVIHSEVNELRSAYKESVNALESSFYYPGKKIILPKMVKPKGVINETVLIKKIYDSIKDADIDSFCDTISEIRETLLNETPSLKHVRSLASNICSIALDFYYNTKGYQYNTFKSHSEITAEIAEITDIDSMLSYVKDFVKSLIDCPKNKPEEKHSKVTEKVIEYLNDHYNKKVSLQEISDYVSLTPTYLSKVIKKDTGKSFVDLFNNIKISMAQKLLKESNLKVYEVANKVGIDNYSYFYQLFKKATGISPTDYYNNRTNELSVK